MLLPRTAPAARRRVALALPVMALTAAALVAPATATIRAHGSAARSHSHVRVTFNRTAIPATGKAQPVPRHLHIKDPHHQMPHTYTPEPVRPKVTARITDDRGHAVTHERVVFTATRGVRFGKVVNHHNGRYTALVIAGKKPGWATIRAHATRHHWVSARAPLKLTFAALHTSGTRIVDAAGHTVMLRGVNFQPSAPDPYLANEFPAKRIYDGLSKHWKPTVVRAFLDLAQWERTPCLQKHRTYDQHYRSVFQSFVRSETERGIFVILALRKTPRRPCDTSDHYLLPAASDSDTGDANAFWSDVATTFRHNPMVGFDLYNEPTTTSSSLWLSGGPIGGRLHRWHATGMQSMYDAVRNARASNLVFVEGPGWANLTPPSLISGGHATNVVYTAHYYSCPKPNRDGPGSPYDCSPGIAPPAPRDACPSGAPLPAWDNPAAVLDKWVTWRDRFHVPIMEDEFGWPGNSHRVDRCFIRETIAYNEAHHIPWATYSWLMWSDHTFGLAKHPAHGNFRPTANGCPVFRALTGGRCTA
jgi:cellulase (glycosyl hydrolase family 5)